MINGRELSWIYLIRKVLSVCAVWVFNFRDKVNSAGCLPQIKYFGLTVSISWPVCRNANSEESSLGVSLIRIYISSVSLEWHAREPKRREEFLSRLQCFGHHQKWVNMKEVPLPCWGSPNLTSLCDGDICLLALFSLCGVNFSVSSVLWSFVWFCPLRELILCFSFLFEAEK